MQCCFLLVNYLLFQFPPQLSTPAGSSQDELSLLEFERGSTPIASSSSSEEPKTELSTLQDSLRDVLLRSAAAQLHAAAIEPLDAREQLMREIASQTGGTAPAEHSRQPQPETQLIRDAAVLISDPAKPTDQEGPSDLASVDINDSLLDMFRNRCFLSDDSKPITTTLDDQNNIVDFAKTAKSPDLEEIPLPCIPEPETVPEKGKTRREGKLETIVESAQSPPDTYVMHSGSSLGAVKKVPSEKVKGGILPTNLDLNWASIPMTSPPETPQVQPPKRAERPESVDHGTLTEPAHFDLWRSDVSKGEFTILITASRNINAPDTPLPVRSKAAIAMFDKSTATSEENQDILGVQGALQVLAAMFPNVPPADLADLLEKCQHDAQWVAELITDSSLPTLQPLEGASVSFEEPGASVCFEEPVDPKIETIISDGKKTIKRRKDRKGPSSELSQLLKKEIESSFQIGNEHYSDHVLHIKKVREGDFSSDKVVSVPEEIPTPDAVSGEAWVEEDGEAAAAAAVGAVGRTFSPEDGERETTIPMPLDPDFFQQLVARFAGPGVAPRDSLKGIVLRINFFIMSRL